MKVLDCVCKRDTAHACPSNGRNKRDMPSTGGLAIDSKLRKVRVCEHLADVERVAANVLCCVVVLVQCRQAEVMATLAGETGSARLASGASHQFL